MLLNLDRVFGILGQTKNMLENVLPNLLEFIPRLMARQQELTQQLNMLNALEQTLETIMGRGLEAGRDVADITRDAVDFTDRSSR